MPKEQPPKKKAPDAAQKKRRKKAPGTPAKKGKSGKRADRSAMTFIRIGRSIRRGGTKTVRYTKQAIGRFNTFANTGEVELETPKELARFRINFPLFLLISAVILVIALLALDNGSITIDTQTISIAGLPNDLEGYTILHVSDLHGKQFGEKQSALLRTINGQSYNLLLMTGDMIGSKGDPQALYDFLDGLALNRHAFIIPGDSDPSPLLDTARDISAPLNDLVLADWVLELQQRDVTYLAYPMSVTVGQSTVWLSPDHQLSLNIPETVNTLEEQLLQEREGTATGIVADYETLPFTNYRYNVALHLQQAAADMLSSNDLHIALSHYPPTMESIAVSQSLSQEGEKSYLRPVDLILAGHYCGGGWKVPLYGAFYIPNTMLDRHGWFPAQEDVQGLKYLGSTTLYTSAGLAMTDSIWLPKIRLFNTAQVSLITLTSEIQSDLTGQTTGG